MPPSRLLRLRWCSNRKIITNLGDSTFGLYNYGVEGAQVIDSWEALHAALPYVHEDYLWREDAARAAKPVLPDLEDL